MLPKFIFIHIPKTAGTSFRENVLKPLYRDKFYYDKSMTLTREEKEHNLKNDLMLYNWGISNYPQDFRKYDVIGGHFSFDKYKRFDSPMITFLREPLERIVSHYYFYRKMDGFYTDKTIVEFSEIYANFMSKQLGYDLNRLEFVGLTEYYDESIKRFADKFELDLPKGKNKKHREDKIVHTVTDEEAEIIKEINKDDYELYNDVFRMYN